LGYTHYLETKHEIPQEKWNDEFIPAVKLVITKAGEAPWNIPITNGHGEEGTEPLYEDDNIYFNGLNPPDEYGYETMEISRLPQKFYFCKTARKPYDPVCVAVMILAETLYKRYFSWTSDGDDEPDYKSEGERLLYQALEFEALNAHGLRQAIKKKLAAAEVI